MRPLMAINGILLGSCLSIAVSLALVLIVFLILRDEYPRLAGEIRPLTGSFLIFLSMTAISGGSFYALAVSRPWRYWVQGLMWIGFLLTGWYYWP